MTNRSGKLHFSHSLAHPCVGCTRPQLSFVGRHDAERFWKVYDEAMTSGCGICVIGSMRLRSSQERDFHHPNKKLVTKLRCLQISVSRFFYVTEARDLFVSASFLAYYGHLEMGSCCTAALSSQSVELARPQSKQSLGPTCTCLLRAEAGIAYPWKSPMKACSVYVCGSDCRMPHLVSSW